MRRDSGLWVNSVATARGEVDRAAAADEDDM